MTEYSDVIDEVKKDYVRDLCRKGKRPDERELDEYRNAEITKGVINTAEGSAQIKLGNTQVLVGIKFDKATPYADRPTQGVFSTSSELLPMASPTFEPGPPNPRSIELARVVDRGIRSAEIVDLDKFFIAEGSVLAMYMDIYVLDHDGNLIDAAGLAAMSALQDTKMPKLEEGKIVRGEYTGNLELKGVVIPTTFAKIENTFVCDPGLDEEAAMDARVTIATCNERVCAIQKGGSGAITQKDMDLLIDKAFVKAGELKRLL